VGTAAEAWATDVETVTELRIEAGTASSCCAHSMADNDIVAYLAAPKPGGQNLK
jgi:hypothetical protein